MMLCNGPKRERHEIPDGARKITLTTVVDWGADDLRADHGKDYVFCSFACVADWASARAEQHDNRVLGDGAKRALTEYGETLEQLAEGASNGEAQADSP